LTDVAIVDADLSRADHAEAVRHLTAGYALDPMGNGSALSDETLDRLVPALRAHPTSVVLLAYSGETAIGLATCFLGFSTFAARPLLNLHDLTVAPAFRGRGVGRALLERVEAKARQLGCVKVTLEVGDRNDRARDLYERLGFRHASAGRDAGAALFYSKAL
jgi:ribosomal protein S18 acetylase RimI-like enzyme